MKKYILYLGYYYDPKNDHDDFILFFDNKELAIERANNEINDENADFYVLIDRSNLEISIFGK